MSGADVDLVSRRGRRAAAAQDQRLRIEIVELLHVQLHGARRGLGGIGPIHHHDVLGGNAHVAAKSLLGYRRTARGGSGNEAAGGELDRSIQRQLIRRRQRQLARVRRHAGRHRSRGRRGRREERIRVGVGVLRLGANRGVGRDQDRGSEAR